MCALDQIDSCPEDPGGCDLEVDNCEGGRYNFVVRVTWRGNLDIVVVIFKTFG